MQKTGFDATTAELPEVWLLAKGSEREKAIFWVTKQIELKKS